MQLNFEKCKVMHIGKRNPMAIYTMLDRDSNSVHTLDSTTSERDLGIQITSNLLVKEQVAKAVSKANRMLGLLKNSFVSRDETLWKKLYIIYIRPQLEYCNQVWHPYLKGNVEALEKVQRRATRMAHSLKGLDYESRLKKLNLITISVRRKRGDLITQYKIFHKIDEIEWSYPLKSSKPRAGKRAQLLRELVPNCLQRFNFFSNRIARLWNKVPDSTINSKNVNIFKNKIDIFLANQA